jgi:hypothetical protein
MSNGQQCCLRRVCCPALKQLEAWTIQFIKWFSAATDEQTLHTHVAARLLASHDPAPLGTAAAVVANWTKSDSELGAAIRLVYQATMDEAAAHEHESAQGE